MMTTQQEKISARSHAMKGGRRLLLAGGLLYLVLPALVPLVSRTPFTDPSKAQARSEQRNASAFATMLGEFRTSLSDMIFIKTERYLDRGVGYEPHVDTRAMASDEKSEGQHQHDDHNHAEHDAHDGEHNDSGTEKPAKTLIKSANQDFRGFIGNLERQVKPWRPASAPHDHASSDKMSEVLPWYRLATLSNPHDVRNYYIGAWWLKTLRTPAQRQEAVRFLDEGISANPTAYELYLMRGYVQKDEDDLKAARDSFRQSADIGLKRRPPGGAEGGKDPGWDTTNDEQLQAAIDMDVMLTRDLETTATAKQILSGYKKRLPDEPALSRMEQVLDEGTSSAN